MSGLTASNEAETLHSVNPVRSLPGRLAATLAGLLLSAQLQSQNLDVTPAADSNANNDTMAAALSEVEPNNNPDSATLLESVGQLSGELDVRDTDYFRFTLDDKGNVRDFGFELESEARVDLCLFGPDSERIKCSRGSESGFSEMGLAGEYILSISTVHVMEKPVAYRLTFGTPRSAKPAHEVEPNDRWEDAFDIATNEEISGVLSSGDKDSFHFAIGGQPQLWRIETTGGANQLELRSIGGIALQERNERGDGVHLDNLLLLPGDYVIRAGRNNSATRDTYTIAVRSLGIPENIDTAVLVSDASASTPRGRIELEPNDSDGQAMRLGFDEPRVGLLGKSDTDMYRFFLPGHGRIRVTAVPATGGMINLQFDSGINVKSEGVDQPTVFEGELPPGDHYLRLRSRPPGNGFYALTMQQLDPLQSGQQLAGVRLTLTGRPGTLAAYQPIAQRIKMGMTVANESATAMDLDVVTASSDYNWRLHADQETLSLAPGQSKRVAVNIDVLADARADRPTLLSLGVSNAAGAVAVETVNVDADCSAPPVNPRQIWPLPARLLGRINAASAGLGAKLLSEGRHHSEAFDGEVGPGSGAWEKPDGTGAIRVDLAGENPLTVIGTIIHPVGGEKPTGRLREFQILTSMDGNTYSPVFDGELTMDTYEQAFVFDEPVKARFAEIRLKSNFDGRTLITLGEWKVIVSESADVITGAPVNVGDNRTGGYDVYSDPFTGANCCHEAFSTVESDGQFSKPGNSYEWVMGFQDNRAAMITALRWVDNPKRGHVNRDLSHVRVAVSLKSPVGPWRELGDWALERDADGVKPWNLDEPLWARFVRFNATPLASGTVANIPLQVQIIEQVADETYQSVIGEWGYTNRDAIYERLNPAVLTSTQLDADDNDSRSRATSLRPDNAVSGQVLIDEDIDWYVIEVPVGNNQLRIQLRGNPDISYAYEIQDANGNILGYEEQAMDDGIELTISTGPGRYYLKLYEPIRSILFSWDTSGSVSRFYDVIDHTMKTFAAGVKTGREEVNLLPFNDGPLEFLLDDWSGDSSEVLKAVVNSDRKYSSSNAESALQMAVAALEEREGTRAIIFITDAVTDGYRLTHSLWRAIKRVHPRVFSFDIGVDGYYTAQDQLQSYADINNGFYDQAFSAGDLQVGFDRAICLLRRPKTYQVLAQLDAVEAKPPGQLKVVLTDDDMEEPDIAGDAVEVILDASGSMYQKLDGRFRYEIAKAVLDDLIETTLPDNIGFALRVFGNRDASSCRTDLEVPLGPLDRTAARKVIAGIEPQPYAYTPIAASLNQVPLDLKFVTGRRTVVLVTDGVESCDGDVDAAIENLKAAGLDMQLNVIGFDFDADDKEAAREQFRQWASLGNGSYFDAANAKELADSLIQAVSAPVTYDVININGDVVASGIVNGESIELLQGTYSVHPSDPTVKKAEKVIIYSKQQTETRLTREP